MISEFIWLPDCDRDGVPKQKMPNCPNCGEDELGMVNPGEAFCYRCNKTFLQAASIQPPVSFRSFWDEE